MRTLQRTEEGGAFVWMIALCGIAMILMFGAAQLGSAVVTKVHTQNAADAASLAGAYEIAHLRESKACGAARTAAEKNDARVTSCETTSSYVQVEVKSARNDDVKAKSRAEVN